MKRQSLVGKGGWERKEGREEARREAKGERRKRREKRRAGGREGGERRMRKGGGQIRARERDAEQKVGEVGGGYNKGGAHRRNCIGE